jgi:hypothetical protein
LSLLSIRDSQVAAMSAQARAGFVERMLMHWGRCFANHVHDRDTAGLQELIEKGTIRAAKYGIVAEIDVCLFLDVVLIFGLNFDDDPAYPWAGTALRSGYLSAPWQRVRFLVACAKDQPVKLEEGETA